MYLITNNRFIIGFFAGILLFAILAPLGCADANPATGGQSGFETELSSITALPCYANASWGIMVVDPETGEVLYAKNPDEMFVPASATKIFTSAALLETLGPDYRFKTPVYAVPGSGGENGTDLVLVASGDPNMGGRRLPDGTIEFMNSDHSETPSLLTETDPLSGLEDLAKQVKASGVTRVSDVVIDDRLFENVKMEYMDLLSPIVINDNMIDISLTPGAAGTAPSLTSRPKTAAYHIENQATTEEAGTNDTLVTEEKPAGTIVVSGSVAADAGMVNKTYSVTDPASFARTLFIEALTRQGVQVTTNATGDNPGDKLPDAEEYTGERKVAELTSSPLSEDVKLTLKVSQNMHANYYIMLLALADNKTSYYDGMTKEGEALRSLGLNTSTMALGDGAGGDRVNRVSPRTTVELLTLMNKQLSAEAFLKALPILGVDGSTANHCKPGNPGCGHVYAKTGTSSWPDTLNSQYFLLSKALAGYIDTKNGKRLVFAEFVNNVPLVDGLDGDAVGTDLGSIAGLIYENY